jgi:hypothetical protein
MRLPDSRLAVAMAAELRADFSRIASAANVRAQRKQNE